MIIDVVIVIISILAFVRGWEKGLIWSIVSLLAVILGCLVSLKLSHTVANYLREQAIIDSKYVLIVTYIILFLLVMYGLRLITKFVEKILDSFLLGWVNKLIGGAVYVLFSLFLISSILWLANEVQMVQAQVKHDAQLYSLVEPIAPEVIVFGGDYLPILKDLYQEVDSFLEKASTTEL